MTIGIGIGSGRGGVGLGRPGLDSLNFALVDTAGAGSDIVVTGTNLSGVSAVDLRAVGSGGAWTPAASLGANTSTTQAFQMPALTAGNYDLRITGPKGPSTMISAIEVWDPPVEAACTFLVDRYVYNAGTGIWTARKGANLSSTPFVHASSGSPNFDGTSFFDGTDQLASLLAATGGTIAFVATGSTTTSINGPSYSTSWASPSILTDAGNGSLCVFHGDLANFGQAGTRAFGASVLVGSTRYGVNAAANTTDPHAVVVRFTSSTLKIRVDGGADVAAGTPPNGNWTTAPGGVVRIGARYDAGSKLFRGVMRAMAMFNASVSDAVVAKFFQWSRQRHGVV
jgi:hypothetical protein